MFTAARIETERPVSDDEFWEFCAANPDSHVEREPNGDIVIMPPAGGETGHRNMEISYQLTRWSHTDGRGAAFDSSTNFILPNGAARSPDAAWIMRNRLARLTKQQKQRFLPLCPDFIVELRSPSDRLPRLKAKMEEWIENGAQLGWLIDADHRTIHVYRPGASPEELVNVDSIAGEGPVAGFVLELVKIWEGL